MSNKGAAGSNKGNPGIRAAKDLLELLDKHSEEEFEAAVAILGNQPDLVNILRLLASYQQRADEPELKAKTVQDLVEVVRAELVGFGIYPEEMASIAARFVDSTMPLGGPTIETLEDVVHQVLEWIDAHSGSPRDHAITLIEFVLRAAHLAGPKHEEKVVDALGALTVEALAGNFVMFSDAGSIADLRRRWSKKPLDRSPRESRREVAARLLEDARTQAPESYRDILEKLLVDGLRSPTDTATMLMRRMGLPKATPPPATAKPTREFAKVAPSAKKIQLLKKAK